MATTSPPFSPPHSIDDHITPSLSNQPCLTRKSSRLPKPPCLTCRRPSTTNRSASPSSSAPTTRNSGRSSPNALLAKIGVERFNGGTKDRVAGFANGYSSILFFDDSGPYAGTAGQPRARFIVIRRRSGRTTAIACISVACGVRWRRMGWCESAALQSAD
jgi:hypothetical protein